MLNRPDPRYLVPSARDWPSYKPRGPEPEKSGGVIVLPFEDPRKLRLDWVIYEEVGAVYINDQDSK